MVLLCIIYGEKKRRQFTQTCAGFMKSNYGVSFKNDVYNRKKDLD